MRVHDCDLPGISCKAGFVTKIDLRDALLCEGDSDVLEGRRCKGIPIQIRYVSYPVLF